MQDGNVLLRQKRDEVPEGTLSCPDRNLAVFQHYRHYEGLRLLPSVYDSKLIQQTLTSGHKKGGVIIMFTPKVEALEKPIGTNEQTTTPPVYDM